MRGGAKKGIEADGNMLRLCIRSLRCRRGFPGPWRTSSRWSNGC